MANITYNQAETHILSVYFRREPEDFGPFYVGLGVGSAPLDENTTLADISLREVTGAGYERVMIRRDDTAQGWSLRDHDMVQSPELTFTNTSLTECWDPINFAFLTLSSEGALDPDVIISAVDLRNTKILEPGKIFKIYYRFKQSTFAYNYERSSDVCGEANLAADANIDPVDFEMAILGVAMVSGTSVNTYEDGGALVGNAQIGGGGGLEVPSDPSAVVGNGSINADAIVC